MRGDSFVSQELIAIFFQQEAVRFSNIIESHSSDELNKLFKKLSDLTVKNTATVKLPGSLKKNKHIDASLDKGRIKSVLELSQIAVCCHLFNGCKYPVNNLSADYMSALAQAVVNGFLQQHGDKAIDHLSFVLESVEGVRVDIMLRGLGLLSLPRHKSQYLSIGSGAGIKDLEAIYADAWLDKESSKEGDLVQFNVRQKIAQHTILVDSDIGYKDRYESLNDLYEGDVLALNEKLDVAMEHINVEIKKGSIMKRNILIASRMDPVMLPDVDAFFRKLKSITTETSNFIVSIGSGNDISEFQARLRKLREIEEYLVSRKLDVYRIKLCKGRTPEEMVTNPMFGYQGHAVYEVLFCKIKNKLLKS